MVLFSCGDNVETTVVKKQHNLTGEYSMTVDQIINAMKAAKVFEAGKLAVETNNVDNLSMLVAVATGEALMQFELYDIYNALNKYNPQPVALDLGF